VRVLLQGRSARSIQTAPGGDQVSLVETAAALREHFDVDAVPCAELEPDLRGFDAVHLFGLVRPQEVWVQARHAHRAGLPIFLSTLYCDFSEFELRDRQGPVGWVGRHTSQSVFEALKAGGRTVVSHEWSKGTGRLFTRGYRRMQRDVLAMTTAFLPASASEWLRMQADFGLPASIEDRVHVVPIGVDLAEMDQSLVTDADLEPFAEFRDCVLCVARMEGRKNQPRLIDALAGTGMTVVIAGRPTPNQPSYVARVREAARRNGNAHVLGGVTSAQKRALFHLARVHALPSWMETCGISSLEGAVTNCSLVVSPNGDTRDYFGDDAHYCDPADPADIRSAVQRAFATPPPAALEARVRSQFTWERAAAETFRCYQTYL
jgi:glycosyltransferase involved in cell wall biosynthesis